MNYIESKNKLDKIRQEYGCKGDVIFRTAIQYIVEHGQYNLRDETWFDEIMNDIDERHDMAERNKRVLWVTRDFEKAIMECAKELSYINSYDLLVYIQKEVWLGGEIGEPDYNRSVQIIRNCLCYMADRYGTYRYDSEEVLEKFRCVMNDDEIEYFGWTELFEEEDK